MNSYELVLNVNGAGGTPQLETYIDTNSQLGPEFGTALPYVCEADIAIRIESLATGSSLATGKALTYGAIQAGSPQVLSNAQPICRVNFGSSSGNVVCKENGWDKGKALSSDLTQQANGAAPRATTAANCAGTGEVLPRPPPTHPPTNPRGASSP